MCTCSSRLRRPLQLVLLAAALGTHGEAQVARAGAASGSQGTRVEDAGVVVDAYETARWRALASEGSAITIPTFPLSSGEVVDLDLLRFSVTTPDTRFVVGPEERRLDFDPSSVLLLRGTVRGRPGSSVFLALSEHGSLGHVDLGGTGGRFEVASVRPPTTSSPGGARISRSTSAGGWSLPVALCGADTGASEPPRTSQAVASATGPKRIELAVETDYELFQLFGDLSATSAYVVSLYGAVSEIYVRDVDAWVELTYVRLWNTAGDLFNEPDPLVPFRTYWEANMGAVPRDAAQFFTGRRDLDYGGVGYVSALCTPYAYSVAGYALGFFVDPYAPSVGNRDITVTAHELGHNCGSLHTHDYGLDTCDDETSSPRRGTLMSYCGQTFTGGEANMDMRFHTVVQDVITSFLAGSPCVEDDCNRNGVPDGTDIAMGTSLDANGNGVPDECEDCNGNGTLDPADIAMGTSTDLNGNGVPDECEPDCNGNLVPDDLDIQLATSPDLDFDRIPDECEPDCDMDGTLDYVQIIADMSLDLNRNAVLDSCEDADGDGTTDLVELDHANDVWIASLDHTTLREYLADVGTYTQSSDEAMLGMAQDLIITPNRRMLVSDALLDRVVVFDADGTLRDDLVPSGAGGLSQPGCLTLTPRGTLLVASQGTNEVLEFRLGTGDPLGAFVTAGSGGLVQPFGLSFGPPGDLYVTSADGRVLRYDGRSGRFVAEFVDAAGNGGLDEPRGVLFLPSGNLLVASHETDQVLEYEAGTGDFVRQFNQGGTATRLTLDQPWCLRLGPNGNVFVSRTHDHLLPRVPGSTGEDVAALHFTNARIYEFDVDLGFFVRAYVLGVNSGVEFPTGFDFVPGTGLDCNRNLLPDDDDILLGFSSDLNLDGIPDECNADCNGNGQADFLDIALGTSVDCDGNGVPDECGGFADCNANGIPDACELAGNDANGNGILDACEGALGRSTRVRR